MGSSSRTRITLFLATAIVVAAAIILVSALIDAYATAQFHHQVWFVWLAGGLGVILGGSEILSRYRDQPVSALLSQAGLIYLLTNGIISAVVYGILVHYSADLIPQIAKDYLLGAIIAGFGAMAILRSKFFTFTTTGGSQIAVGPDIVAQAYLDSSNRAIDRQRALDRLRLVHDLTQTVAKPLPRNPSNMVVSLGAFQSLSTSEQADLQTLLNQIYARADYSDDMKFQASCFAIVNVGGERVLRRIISDLPGPDTPRSPTEGTTEAPNPAGQNA
jgi:hypothetical protein